jgi:hypothetical protein
VGKPTNWSNFAPCNIPVTCISAFRYQSGWRVSVSIVFAGGFLIAFSFGCGGRQGAGDLRNINGKREPVREFRRKGKVSTGNAGILARKVRRRASSAAYRLRHAARTREHRGSAR